MFCTEKESFRKRGKKSSYFQSHSPLFSFLFLYSARRRPPPPGLRPALADYAPAQPPQPAAALLLLGAQGAPVDGDALCARRLRAQHHALRLPRREAGGRAGGRVGRFDRSLSIALWNTLHSSGDFSMAYRMVMIASPCRCHLALPPPLDLAGPGGAGDCDHHEGRAARARVPAPPRNHTPGHHGARARAVCVMRRWQPQRRCARPALAAFFVWTRTQPTPHCHACSHTLNPHSH